MACKVLEQRSATFALLAALSGCSAAVDEPTGAASASAQAGHYENPLSSAADPGPFIFRDLSLGSPLYFRYSGAAGVRVSTSTDLNSWSSGNNALNTLPSWAARKQSGTTPNPAVFRNSSGTYVLYFTAQHGMLRRPCIGVATASRAQGPFSARNEPLLCSASGAFTGASDPHLWLIKNPQGDDFPQLLFVGHDESTGTGNTIWSQALTADGLSIRSDIARYKLLTAQPDGWEAGRLGSPALVWDYAAKKGHLLFSGGAPSSRDHAIGVAACDQSYGVVTRCTRETLGAWSHETADVRALGSPAPFSDGQHLWLAYSAHNGSDCTTTSCTGTRTARIDKLCLMEGALRSNGPTTGAQSLGRASACLTDVPPPSLSAGTGPVASDPPILQGWYTTLWRDAAVSGVVGERPLWLYGDTFALCRVPGLSWAICSNSAAYSEPPGGSTNVTEWPTAGAAQQLIPNTPDELALFDEAKKQRAVLWPGSVISRRDGTALVTFSRHITVGAEMDPPGAPVLGGSGIACVSRTGACRTASGQPADVVRLGNVFATGERAYVKGAVTAGEFTYFYDQANYKVFVARAPVGEEHLRGSYEFYTGSGWSDTEPSPPFSITDTPTGSATVNVSFNPYLGKYLMVTQEIWFGSRAHLRTADEPQGDWSAPTHVDIPEQFTAPGKHLYAFEDHPELSPDGGRTLVLSYFNNESLRIMLRTITLP